MGGQKSQNRNWAPYRTLQRIYYVLASAYVIVFVAFVLQEVFRRFKYDELPIFVETISWSLIICVAGLLLFPCPSCGKPFQLRRWKMNIDSKECVHCGLARNSSRKDSDARAPLDDLNTDKS
jgi:uncharacterized metal-binding protein (TIGR02443 family)